MTANSVIDRIGHGALGLRSNLRSFYELMDTSAARRDACIEIRPTRQVTAWGTDSGGAYVSQGPVEFIYRGVRSDIVDVFTDDEASLTRAESLAACEATASTYYYDPDAVYANGLVFDTPGQTFDDGVLLWDQFPKLYVHLAAGADPNLTTVCVRFGLYFSQRGMIQPSLGPNLIVDGGFEGTLSDNWTAANDAGFTTSFETLPRVGAQELVIQTGGSDVGLGSVASKVAMPVVAGELYRFSGYYKTDAGLVSDLGGSVFDFPSVSTCYLIVRGPGGTPSEMYDDGRTYTNSGITGDPNTSSPGMVLTPTGGQWRRFVYDWRAPFSSAKVLLVLKSASAAGVYHYVRFDAVALQRVWRFNYYEPRILVHTLPAAETGSADLYFGGQTAGLGSVTLDNDDGAFDSVAGSDSLDWPNAQVIARDGGELLDGQELSFEDFRARFTGVIDSAEVSDRTLFLQLNDLRYDFHTQLPKRLLDQQFSACDPTFAGAPRPYLFGAKTNITPIRINKEATYGKYGVYELADCTDVPNGISAVNSVYSYTDKASAASKLMASRLLLVVATDYTVDLANGRFTVIGDVRPYQIVASGGENGSGNLIDFHVGGSNLVATATLGLYTAAQLATHIAAIMTAAAGVTINCTYDNTTNLFTISKPSGTLTILAQTGANAKVSLLTLMGFRLAADLSSALTYTGNDSTFTDVDQKHVLRVDATGYLDDASGTYTGSASAVVRKGADMVRFILGRFLKTPLSYIDAASFLDARNRATDLLCLYLATSTPASDIIGQIESSNLANLVIDGSGTIFYRVFATALPAGTPTLVDADFYPGGFVGIKAVTDVYPVVQVLYDQDPSDGSFLSVSASDTTVPLRFRRLLQKQVTTLFAARDSAATVCNALLSYAVSPPQQFNIICNSKLLDREFGDKVIVSRRRGMSDTGVVSTVFRILRIKKEADAGRITATLALDFSVLPSQPFVFPPD